jgi:hypothetical protein
VAPPSSPATPTQNENFFHLNPLIFRSYSKYITQNPKILTVRPDRSKNFERKNLFSLCFVFFFLSFYFFLDFFGVCVFLCMRVWCCCGNGLMCCWFWVDGSWENENGYWWCCYCDVWILFDVRILLVKWWCYWFLLFGYGLGYWWDFCIMWLMKFFGPFSFPNQPPFIVTMRSVNTFTWIFQFYQLSVYETCVLKFFFSSNSVLRRKAIIALHSEEKGLCI